jgi:hypothetical protein
MPIRELVYAIVFVAALLLLYGGAYLAMMERFDLGISSIAGEETPIVTYRFGGEWSEGFFTPAHEIDRRVRPDLWRNERDREALGPLKHLKVRLPMD